MLTDLHRETSEAQNSSTSSQVRSEPTTGLVRWRRNFQLPSSYSRICIAPLTPSRAPPVGGMRMGVRGGLKFLL